MNLHKTPGDNAASALATPDLTPEITTLPNGLGIITLEDHSSPVVAAQVWCRAGSINEGTRLGAGLSHVLEHMLFKGTETRDGGQIDREVQEAGGYMNAYTSFDHTVYLINAPSSGLNVALDILSDIVQHATLPEDELIKEKDVILREMDMLQDDPSRRASRRLFETAYTRSPYRYPIIGLPDIYNELKREDIFGYYREKYCPNNLYFVVVGDIDSSAVVDRISKAFENTPARSLPPEFLPTEPPQTSSREVIEEASIQLGHMHCSWHIPEVRHDDVPLIDVFSTILGGGRSSRLYQKLRESEGIAHAADAWTYNPGNPGLFGVSAVMDGDKFSKVRDAVSRELDLAIEKGVTQKEVDRAIKQTVSATYSSRKTMQGIAQDLGHNWLTSQDLNFSRRFLSKVQSATPEAIATIARRHLTSFNQTLYALLPEGAAPKATKSANASVTNEIEKIELSNGLRVLLKQDARLPFIEYRAVFTGGVIAENEENNGISGLMSRMLTKGTTSRSAEQIANEIESIGGHLDSYAGNNSFGINVETLATDLPKGIELLADVLLNPSFPAEQLEREKAVQLAAIRAQDDQLLQKTSRIMRETLFGRRGLGLHQTGLESSVSALSPEKLAAFHQTMVTPKNAVVSIFGNFDRDALLAELNAWLGDWTSGTAFDALPETKAVDEAKRVVQKADKKQAVVVVGFAGVDIRNEDQFALELIQECCSDLGSRLFTRIRDDLGLAYYVGAQNVLGLVPGFFAFYAGTSPENAAKVEEEILKEARELATNGLSEEELIRAKAKLLGHNKISRQELGNLATSTALDELYGLGFDNFADEDARYEKVTGKEVLAVAAKYLTTDRCVTAIVGG